MKPKCELVTRETARYAKCAVCGACFETYEIRDGYRGVPRHDWPSGAGYPCDSQIIVFVRSTDEI